MKGVDDPFWYGWRSRSSAAMAAFRPSRRILHAGATARTGSTRSLEAVR